jgi:osmoprotectant transport system permease protein
VIFAQGTTQADDPFVAWDWVWAHTDDISAATWEHLQLTAVAVGIGFVISMVLAMVGLRFPRAYPPITWTTGVMYTIPSLALFANLVPLTGLTFLTAEIGLVSYTLLILIRNITAGINGVPAEIREAALGMGYTPRRMFWEIEVPLALPAIMAGLRIATVTTVGLVTVTALITYGGLGSLIYSGLNRFFNTEIVVGVVLSVVLALVLDIAIVLVERWLTPWARRRATAAN